MKDRMKYWDDYHDYWKERIKNEKIVPSNDIIEWLINQVKIDGKILEVGCGWGRLFSFFSKLDIKVYAIDISNKMIEEAKQKKNDNIIEIIRSEAENLPYNNNSFDYIICIAVFDILFQEQSFSEMMRVLKLGGKLLITGKNNNFIKDDYRAYEAEEKAKEKGFPNSFTNIVELKKQLHNKKHKIVLEYYFLQRLDFAMKKFIKKMPENFYEYFLIIKKGSNNIKFTKFSSKGSKK